jgi:Rieske Fe-S protein
MTIPSVTFPIPQDKIKEEADRVRQALSGLNAELSITREIYRTIQTICQHKGCPCIKCGYDD